MKTNGTLLLAGALLTGCITMSPEQMAGKSHWDVCRFTMGGPHSGVAQQEASRRGLDCAPLYPAISAQMQNEAAAVRNYLQATQPTAPAVRQPVNCTSRRVGNTVQTDCW